MKFSAFMIIFILALSTLSYGAELNDFIRGTWLTLIETDTGYFKCFPGMTGWNADEVDWTREKNLLEGAHMNLISAFLHFERQWMSEVCLASGGDIKMYIGFDTQYCFAHPYHDSLNITFWIYGNRWAQYPSQSWRNGYDAALEHWAAYADSNEAGVFGYTVAHEMNNLNDPDSIKLKKYSLINYMSRRIREIDDPNHFANNIEGSNIGGRPPITRAFLDSVQYLDLFEYDIYPYGWGNLAISGVEFQAIMDNMLYSHYDTLFCYFTEHTPWVADIQTFFSFGLNQNAHHSCKCEEGASGWEWTIFEDSLYFGARMPSREEMRLQTFLAISRGAKGAMCFVYGPSIRPLYYIYVGLIDYNDGRTEERRAWNAHDDPYYGDHAFNYPSADTTPYNHIAELFAELEQIGPLLVKLKPTAIASYGVPDTLKWVGGTASDWVAKLTDKIYGDTAVHYWEMTTFVDTSTENLTDYFMLVNRVTCPDYVNNDPALWEVADARDVAMIYKRPLGYMPVVQDIYSNEIWFFDSYDSTAQGKSWWTFADSVGPGDGNIYRVTDVFRGPVTDSLELSHDVILTGDLVIDTNGVLVIDPGVTIYVYPDFDDNNQGYSDTTIEIITKGKIYANGTFSDSIKFVPFADSAASGDWVGIYMDEHAIGEFSYCSIQYGDRGIELRSSTEAKVSHCNIGNCTEIGIYNYKGFLDLDNSIIAYNGLYGLYGYMAADSVYKTKFIDNVQYGIRIFGINLSHDTTFILCDTISCMPTPAQYGIYVESNDYMKIRRSKVSSYDMGGIYLNNSDAIIDSCDFSTNTNYGLYAENNAYPRVRHCVFNSLSTGVKANSGAKPDLGIVPDSGYCSFSSTLTYYVYFTNMAFCGPDTLWAQMNYWGSPRPSPSKFFTDCPLRKIIWIPYISSTPKLEPEELIPLSFSLNQNYPNPSNPATTILFTLDKPAHTTITIYNIMGQKIVTLMDEHKAAGEHNVIWDGRNSSGVPVSSGVYFYAIQSGDRFDSKKMLLLR